LASHVVHKPRTLQARMNTVINLVGIIVRNL
jgi:hypothetical protein